MQKDILFSVIMPVYRVERYLKAAIESVLNQTYKNFEIILVDDASPDGSPAICDEYAAKYENIMAVHNDVNQGLSAARNIGLTHITGNYVTFMDSDDYIDPDLFERVYVSLTENIADCVVFGIHEDYCDGDGNISKSFDITYGSEERIFDKEALRKNAIKLEEKTLYGYAWNKFYRTEYIRKNNLFFEKVTLIEDIMFNISFFEDIKALNIINKALYHYMKRENASLTNKFVSNYYELHRKRVKELLEQQKRWKICDDSVRRTLSNIYSRYIYSALQRNCDKRSNMSGKDRRLFLYSVFEDELFKELLPFIDMRGYAGILYDALKNQKTMFCLFFGRAIYIVKEKLPILFAAAKQKR